MHVGNAAWITESRGGAGQRCCTHTHTAMPSPTTTPWPTATPWPTTMPSPYKPHNVMQSEQCRATLSGSKAVEGGGHRGCFRVFGRRPGWMLVVGWSGEDAQGWGGWRRGVRGRGGRPGATLGASFLQAVRAEDGLWTCDLYRPLYGLIPFSFVFFLRCPLFLLFCLAGRLQGSKRSGYPSLTL